MYKSVCIHKISPCCRCNLSLVNHVCKAVPRSLFWVPNGFSELPAVLFEFLPQPDYSGESRGGAHPLLFLDQKNCFGRLPPPYLRVWMTPPTPPPPPLISMSGSGHWISQLNFLSSQPWCRLKSCYTARAKNKNFSASSQMDLTGGLVLSVMQSAIKFLATYVMYLRQPYIILKLI